MVVLGKKALFEAKISNSSPLIAPFRAFYDSSYTLVTPLF